MEGKNALFSFEGQLCTFSLVISIFYNSYIVKMFEIVIYFNVKDNYISECACLHETVNMVVFFV